MQTDPDTGGEHTITEITPDLAAQWLERQFEGQRNARPHHIALLAEEMRAGSFIPHSSVVFAEFDGQSYLIDGQHRLKAITVYGRPVRMPVLRKQAASMQQVREWYSSIDQGLRRTAQDAIRAQGISEELQMSDRHTGRLSGAVRLIATGFSDPTANSSVSAVSARVRSRSNAGVSSLIRAWAPEARAYFEAVQGGEPSNAYLWDRAAVIACGLLTIRYRQVKGIEFWSGIAKDDGLAKEDPRKRFLVFLRDKKERPGRGARFRPSVARALRRPQSVASAPREGGNADQVCGR